MYNYNNTQDSPYDPTKLAIQSIIRPEADFLSNCGHISENTVSFDDIVHFIDEENIVTYVHFDCGITFYPEAPTKFRQVNRERKNISRSFEKLKCIPSNDQHNCFFDEEHTSNIFPNPYNLRNMDPAAFKSLKHTSGRDSMTTEYPQTTHNRPRTDLHPVLSSLRMMDSKRKRLRVSFSFFQKNYLPDGRVKGTAATIEELSDI